jgi:hypothetical protein
MKTLLIILLTAFVFIGEKSGLTISDEKVVLCIDRFMSEKKLLKFQKQLMKEKNIAISFKKMTFAKSGKLLILDMSVNCNDGKSGRANITFQNDADLFGFYRVYDNSLDPVFNVGRMPM